MKNTFQNVPIGWIILMIVIIFVLLFGTNCAPVEGIQESYPTEQESPPLEEEALSWWILVPIIFFILFVAGISAGDDISIPKGRKRN